VTFHGSWPTAAQKRDTGSHPTSLGELHASFLLRPRQDLSINVFSRRSESSVAVVAAWWRRTLGILGTVQPYNSQTRLLISTWVSGWTDTSFVSLPCPETFSAVSWSATCGWSSPAYETTRPPNFLGLMS